MENAAFVNFNDDYTYVNQWILESEFARWDYQRWIWRSSLAKVGKPCKNTYQEELRSNLDKSGPDTKGKYKEICEHVPEGRSFALKKAVDNIAAQMAGGVDTYDYHINDPYMIIDSDTEDLLSAKCEQDYIENNLYLLAPVFSDDIMWYGMAAAIVKYCPVKDKNTVMRIHPKNVWFDTKYSSTGTERFRGYSTMISWSKLKKMLESDKNEEINLNIKAPDGTPVRVEGEGKDKRVVLDKTAKFSNRKIRSLNGLDIYVDSLNKLATSSQLAYGLTEFPEYDHDLRQCYNLGWYRSYADDPKKRTNNGYNGDDVELTVMYDLDRKIEFKVINRRYVISANSKAFKRKINFTWYDVRNGIEQSRIDDFHLDCPLKFKFQTENNMDLGPHPWAPVFPLLDSHDELCGWRARREHVSKILSILRIDTNGADSDSLRRMLNIMGGIYDDLQGDVTSLVLNYNYDPIDSEIAHLENQIQQVLHAYDQFDALQAMGDRASAAESGMAVYAVAQGLAVHQNALMSMFADIARQCIANRVAYSSMQEFAVSNRGEYRSITIQQMALTAVIDVKPKLAKQIQQKQLAANAMALLGSMGETLTEEGKAYLMEQALFGSMPRRLAEHFVREQGPSEQELALAQQQSQNDAMALAQNQQMYEENPIPYEVDNAMQTGSPDEIDAAIRELSGGAEQSRSGETMEDSMQLVDMESQPGGMALETTGAMTEELGSQLANPNSMVL